MGARWMGPSLAVSALRYALGFRGCLTLTCPSRALQSAPRNGDHEAHRCLVPRNPSVGRCDEPLASPYFFARSCPAQVPAGRNIRHELKPNACLVSAAGGKRAAAVHGLPGLVADFVVKHCFSRDSLAPSRAKKVHPSVLLAITRLIKGRIFPE
jgi:hypothetical protein